MDKARRWSRRARIVVLAACLVVLVSAGFFAVLVLTSPDRTPDADPVQQRPVPDEWLAPEPAAEPALSHAPWSSTGSLTFVADGRPFGEETYRIEVSPDAATLTSSGRFWFRVVIANVNVSFRQEWGGTSSLDPVRYSLHVEAPLGRGYEIQGHVDGRAFVSQRGDATTAVPIVPDRSIVLGMFSTYALIPARFAERENDGVALFDALLFGGPPGQETASDAESLPVLTVRRVEGETVAVADRTIHLDRYEVSGLYGESLLYARDKEFLALVAGTAERPFLVYRSDYFPDGFPLGVPGE